MLDAVFVFPRTGVALRDGAVAVGYGELATRVAEKADRLKGLRCVALALDNGVEWVLWDMAAMMCGVVCVPLPPFFSPAMVRHVLTLAGCDAVIDADGVRRVAAVPADFPHGTAKVTFTSGSTGDPAGVCLGVAGMLHTAQSLVQALEGTLRPGGVHVCALPLAVLLENVAGVYAGLLAGCEVVLPSLKDFGLQYENLRAVLAAEKAESVILVPEMLKALLAQVERDGPLPDLRFVAVGGARMDMSLLERARRLALPVYEGYGLSECASVVCLNTPRHHHAGSVGRVLPHVKLHVENGELVVDNPALLGWVGKPHTGPWPTGDVGTLDFDGFVQVTGRRKNVLILSNGRNVSPEWVEAALLAQPAVAQAVVFGDGEAALRALVVPALAGADAPHTMAAAVAAANATLPAYARVGGFQIVAPFTPANGLLTGNGRVRRAAILETHINPTFQQGDRA